MKLAIEVDKQVSSIIDQNKEEFYELNPWLRPPKDDTALDKIINAIDEFVDSAVDFVEKVSEVLTYWYEKCGGKEMLNILKSLVIEAFAIAGVVLSAIALTPPFTPLGIAGLCLSSAALAINSFNTRIDITNEFLAINKKWQALDAEANGDYELARLLREDAAEFSDISSAYDIWWNDGKFNGWDVLGGIMFGVEIADMIFSVADWVSNFSKLAGNLGDLGKVGDMGDLGKVGDMGDLGKVGDMVDLKKADDMGDFGKIVDFKNWPNENMGTAFNISSFLVDTLNLKISYDSVKDTAETFKNSIGDTIVENINAVKDVVVDVAVDVAIDNINIASDIADIAIDSIDIVSDVADIVIDSVDIVSDIIEPINITFVPVEIFIPVVSFD